MPSCRLPPEQKVRGSNPLGRTILLQTQPACHGSLPNSWPPTVRPSYAETYRSGTTTLRRVQQTLGLHSRIIHRQPDLSFSSAYSDSSIMRSSSCSGEMPAKFLSTSSLT